MIQPIPDTEWRWLGVRFYSIWLEEYFSLCYQNVSLTVSHSPLPKKGMNTQSFLGQRCTGVLLATRKIIIIFHKVSDKVVLFSCQWAYLEIKQLYLATYSWQAVCLALSSWGCFILWTKRMQFCTPETLTYLICLKQPTAYSLTYWSG